jgi:hypothetical protein
MNYYDFLEVQQNATELEIKHAYRSLAHIYHPDKNKDKKYAEEKMKELNFIYSILSNPQKRKSYDETLGFEYAYDYSGDDISSPDIYCNELEVTDSRDRRTRIRVGDYIYYVVEIDKSLISWKYKTKEYFNVYVEKIFDPKKKDFYHKAVKFDFKKEPLFIVRFGNQSVVVYKEDYELFWLSGESYNKLDLKKGLYTAAIVGVLLLTGVYYLYSNYDLPSDQKEKMRLSINQTKSNEGDKQWFRTEYFATDGEINYILSGKYSPCTKKTAKIKGVIELRNVPDHYGLVAGEIKNDADAIILLYCKDRDAYKVKVNQVIGWVPGKFLINPTCNDK